MNVSIALGLCKDEILRIFDKKKLDVVLCDKIIKKMSKYKIPVIPNRNFKRHKQKRTKRKFFIHQRSAI